MTTPRSLMLSSILALALLIPSVAVAQDHDSLSADEIIDRMLERNDSFGVESGESSITLLVEDRTGERRARKLLVQSKKVGEQGRTRVALKAPKELAGQAFLFSSKTDGEDDVWMFLPAFKVTRRVEGSQKRGAFLGSHFTFADLESRDVRRATYKKLEDETIGKSSVFVIEVTPKKGEGSEYGKILTYVRKDDLMPLKFKFFDTEKSDVEKTIFVEKIEKTKEGAPYIKQMTLRSASGGFTTIVIDSVEEGTSLPDALFEKDQLGK